MWGSLHHTHTHTLSTDSSNTFINDNNAAEDVTVNLKSVCAARLCAGVSPGDRGVNNGWASSLYSGRLAYSRAERSGAGHSGLFPLDDMHTHYLARRPSAWYENVPLAFQPRCVKSRLTPGECDVKAAAGGCLQATLCEEEEGGDGEACRSIYTVYDGML